MSRPAVYTERALHTLGGERALLLRWNALCFSVWPIRSEYGSFLLVPYRFFYRDDQSIAKEQSNEVLCGYQASVCPLKFAYISETSNTERFYVLRS